MVAWELQTPVVFLIYNRPDTTARVFEVIRRARPPVLFVVADGPNRDRPDDVELCKATRAIVQEIDWPCKVIRNYSDQNLGCKQRVSSGLDWVFGNVHEAIILEDDCVPHPTFFRFCEELLIRYRHDERVMMITGTNYMEDRCRTQRSYLFSRHLIVWGWATWRRAWSTYDVAMQAWRREITIDHLRHLCPNWFVRKHFEQTFDLIYENKIDTWDIQWVFNCLFHNGLCITPSTNLVQNIGIEGLHSRTLTDSHFLKLVGMTFELTHPEFIYPDCTYDDWLFRSKCRKAVIRNLMLRTIQRTAILRSLYRLAKRACHLGRSCVLQNMSSERREV